MITKTKLTIQGELIWPDDRPVTRMKSNKSRVTWSKALAAVQDELKKSEIIEAKITSNIYIDFISVKQKPGQRGTSLIYRLPTGIFIACCDQYYTEADNLMAIAKVMKKYREIRQQRVSIHTLKSNKS